MNTNWIILILGLAGGAFPAWWVTSEHYQKVIAKEHEQQQQLVIEQQEQNRLALMSYAERITKGVSDHDKNTRTIRNISRELDGLRIEFQTCPVSDTSEDGINSGASTGILSNPVDDLFERLQSRTGKLIEEADTLNIDAIRSNSVR